MDCSTLVILSTDQECGSVATPPADLQLEQATTTADDGVDEGNYGLALGRPASPGLGNNPNPKVSRSSSTGHHVPSWISAWAKPTVASSQLTDGVQLREFKARPLPASTARRRTGLGKSPSGDGATAVGAAATGLLRLARSHIGSTGRGSVVPSEGADGATGGGGGGSGISSVLMHFIRASSGPCGALAAPPATAPRPLRTLRKTYTGGAASTTSLGAACGSIPAGNRLRRIRSGEYGGGGSGGTSTGVAEGAGPPRRRPMSAGPRQPPISSAAAGGAGQHESPADGEPTSSNRTITMDPPSGAHAGHPPNASASTSGRSPSMRINSSSNASSSRDCTAGGGQQSALTATRNNGNFRNRPRSAGPATAAAGCRNPTSAVPAATAPTPSTAPAPVRGSSGRNEIPVPLHRGPTTPVTQLGLGPREEDVGYKVAPSDMLLAAGGARCAGGGGGGASPSIFPLQHIPPPQHMFLTGSLQELYERLARSGDRHLHLSLGSTCFSGDLDPAAGNMIRVQNRTVILHNCTLALKPGQKLFVGSRGHVILADVTVVALSGAAPAGVGGSGGEAAATPRGSKGRPPPSPCHAHGSGTPRSRGGGRSATGTSNLGVPLLHAAEGGRLLLRGCCVKTSSAAAAPANGATGGVGDVSTVTSASMSSPKTPVRHHDSSITSGSSPGNDCRGGGGARSPLQILSILVDSGAAVEAIGCRLGRCTAVGSGTWLTVRCCKVKPSSADIAAAATVAAATPLPPLLRAVDGCTMEIAKTELQDGPAQGVAATGVGTKVALLHSAVNGCRRHGVLVCHAAELSAAACRLSSNGATGLTVRGRGTVAELRDCDLSYNNASNLFVGGGSSVSLVSCGAINSGEGCGAALEGTGTRLLAAACTFDGNTTCGVRVRQEAVVELRDCSSSGNTGSGLEVEGTVDSEDNAELMAEATLACTAPPLPPMPEVFCLVAGGQLAKNGAHGCMVHRGGGLRITSGCELSQNGGDGACADGVGCELLLDGCAALGNGESGLFVCSGAAVWVERCRLGGNMHGDVAVGGRGSRGRLVSCMFDYNPVTSLRVHMGARVALRRCTMEPRPAAAPAAPRAKHRLRQLRSTSAQRLQRDCDDDGGSSGRDPGSTAVGPVAAVAVQRCEKVRQAWTVHTVRSQNVQLRGRGSVLSVDGQAYFPLESGEGEEGGAETPLQKEVSWAGPGMAGHVVASGDDDGARIAREGSEVRGVVEGEVDSTVAVFKKGSEGTDDGAGTAAVVGTGMDGALGLGFSKNVEGGGDDELLGGGGGRRRQR